MNIHIANHHLTQPKLETSSFQRFCQIYPPEHMVLTKVTVYIGHSGEGRHLLRFVSATASEHGGHI
jgi:hypothetical protein